MNECQGCGKPYAVDLLIPNEIWELIKPAGLLPGAGFLCGSCIMARIETEYGNYTGFPGISSIFFLLDPQEASHKEFLPCDPRQLLFPFR